MKTTTVRSLCAAPVIVVLAVAAWGCDGSPETAVEVESLRGRATDTTGEALFDVDVRYTGGVTRGQAAALIERIEIFPARDVLPVEQIPALGASSLDDEPLDASEPTFSIVLHPLNDVAAAQRYAWSAPVDVLRAAPPAAPPADGIVGQQSALTANVDISPRWLDHNETWTGSRYRCHSFTFGVEVIAGLVRPCVVQGANGNAGVDCGAPNAAHTSIGDWNPLNEHYFRGRAIGYLTGGELVAAYLVCI